MNNLLLLSFYFVSFLKFNINSIVFTTLIGSSYLLSIIGILYKLSLCFIDKRKIDDKPLKLHIILTEIAKLILITTIFEILPPGIGITIFFILYSGKNVYKIYNNRYDLFSTFHYMYLVGIQFCLYLLTIYSLPTNNISAIILFIKLQDFIPLCFAFGIISTDFILQNTDTKITSKIENSPILGLKYSRNQIIAYFIALIYFIYKESQTNRLLYYLNSNKYLKNIPLHMSMLDMFSIAILYHFINDLLLYISIKLDSLSRDGERSQLSVCLSPLDNRFVLSRSHIKLNHYKEMFDDKLFLPSTLLLVIELLNDLLILNL